MSEILFCIYMEMLHPTLKTQIVAIDVCRIQDKLNL